MLSQSWSHIDSRGDCSGNRGKGQRSQCTYFRVGHTCDRCYQLHGCPLQCSHGPLKSSSFRDSEFELHLHLRLSLIMSLPALDIPPHLVNAPFLFLSFTLLLRIITLAYGAQTMTKGIGSASSSHFWLTSVLYVLDFPFNFSLLLN